MAVNGSPINIPEFRVEIEGVDRVGVARTPDAIGIELKESTHEITQLRGHALRDQVLELEMLRLRGLFWFHNGLRGGRP